jgi:hypothetical protein
MVEAIFWGMKSGIAKTIHYDKVRRITQVEKDNPVSSYDRIDEAFRKYTASSSRQGLALLGQHFITHPTPDIRQKLQKLQLGLQTNNIQLLDAAFWSITAVIWKRRGKDRVRKEVRPNLCPP